MALLVHLMYCRSALNISFWPCLLRFSIAPLSTLRFMSPIDFRPSLLMMSSTVASRMSFSSYMPCRKTGCVPLVLGRSRITVSSTDVRAKRTPAWTSKHALQAQETSTPLQCNVATQTAEYYIPPNFNNFKETPIACPGRSIGSVMKSLFSGEFDWRLLCWNNWGLFQMKKYGGLWRQSTICLWGWRGLVVFQASRWLSFVKM